jgi:hypothetical protein
MPLLLLLLMHKYYGRRIKEGEGTAGYIRVLAARILYLSDLAGFMVVVVTFKSLKFPFQDFLNASLMSLVLRETVPFPLRRATRDRERYYR